MKSEHISISHSGEKSASISNIHIRTIAIFLLLIFFYFSSGNILTLIDNSILSDIEWLRKYSFFIKIILSLIFSFSYIKIYGKRSDFSCFFRNWFLIVIVSFALSGLLSFLLGNTSFWFVKFLIGILTGYASYLINMKLKYPSIGWTTGVIAVLAALFGGSIEYLQTMEPPTHPSLLYVRSFANPIFWIVGVLIIFLPAYLLAKGWLLKTRKDD